MLGCTQIVRKTLLSRNFIVTSIRRSSVDKTYRCTTCSGANHSNFTQDQLRQPKTQFGVFPLPSGFALAPTYLCLPTDSRVTLQLKPAPSSARHPVRHGSGHQGILGTCRGAPVFAEPTPRVRSQTSSPPPQRPHQPPMSVESQVRPPERSPAAATGARTRTAGDKRCPAELQPRRRHQPLITASGTKFKPAVPAHRQGSSRRLPPPASFPSPARGDSGMPLRGPSCRSWKTFRTPSQLGGGSACPEAAARSRTPSLRTLRLFTPIARQLPQGPRHRHPRPGRSRVRRRGVGGRGCRCRYRLCRALPRPGPLLPPNEEGRTPGSGGDSGRALPTAQVAVISHRPVGDRGRAQPVWGAEETPPTSRSAGGAGWRGESCRER